MGSVSRFIAMFGFIFVLAALFPGIQSDEKRLLIDDSQSVSEQLRILNAEVLALKAADVGQGSTYVRWGRTTCRVGAELVYAGLVGGSAFTDSGGSANLFCLPNNPEWGHYEGSVQRGGKVYGGEYEFALRYNGGSSFFGKNLLDEDAPCALCRVPYSTTVMIPARLNCPDESWLKEYSGYLVSDASNHASATEYTCLDSRPEMVPGGSRDSGGRLLYFVEAICGSLSCPPYVNGRELTCVVCSK